MSGQEQGREAVEALAWSVTGCMSNVSKLPEWMQVPALGRDTRPLLLLVAEAVLASDWLAEVVREAEQRGREDNADHGMCYVHGSKALEALIEQAKQRGRDEVVRDVALVADAALRGVNHDPAAATVVIAVNAALKRHVLARHAGADQ